MKQFNCEGLEALSLEGLRKVEGGQIPEWVKGLGKTFTVGYIVAEIIDDWDNVKAGFLKGFNDFSRP